MSAGSVTLAGRSAAEALMTDTCTVTRPGATEPVYDPGTDTYTYPGGTEVYSGKCRVKQADTIDQDRQAGEAVVGARRYVVSLPMSVTGVRRGDSVTVDTSVLDGALPGVVLRVLGAAKGSQITARRLACEEESP